MRRRLLTIAVFLLAGIGVSVLAAVFARSLAPSAQAEADLPRIPMEELLPGTFKLVRHPRLAEWFGGWNWYVLFVRRENGELKAWEVPVRNGNVGMPDIHWWRPAFECADFGPEMRGGVIDEAKPIACRDPEVSHWWGEHWAWSLDGRSLGEMTDDLEPVQGVVEGEHFVLDKW